MKIGIFGGTFNPPHMGHINGANAAVSALGLDKLIFIPAGNPPHKELPKNSATSEQRLRMVELASEYVPHSEVLDIEIKRDGKSYTVDTIRDMHKMYPKAKLYFLVGTDMLKSFHTWYKPEEIAKLCTLCALCRTQSKYDNMEEYASEARSKTGVKIRIVKGPVLEISSTEVRCGMQREKIPLKVLQFIKNNNIYL